MRRLIVLADGCVVEAGDPRQVPGNPRHDATRALLQFGREEKKALRKTL
jgi:ABC-type glutathione transport system ATPase component